jgi:hypothetical protein
MSPDEPHGDPWLWWRIELASLRMKVSGVLDAWARRRLERSLDALLLHAESQRRLMIACAIEAWGLRLNEIAKNQSRERRLRRRAERRTRQEAK